MTTETITPTSGHHAPLIRVDRALESWRDAGHDLSSAAGEPVDNSIEAHARRIRIQTFKVGSGNGKRNKESIEAIAFADDGVGISKEILPNALTMGYSSRYGQRKGLGRFGVGAKLAALSQSRRLDIYTRKVGASQYFHAYFDLEEITSGEQEYILAQPIEAIPAKYMHLMQDEAGKEFESGTLVAWSKVDRLEHEGRFGSSVDERIRDLTKYLGRTYRRFLNNGIRIELNGDPITAHDPLFLLENPVAIELLGRDDWKGEVVDTKKIDIDGFEVEVTVTLVPKKLRLRKNEGGTGGKGEPYKPLRIPDNEGRVTILRNGREIYYDLVPRLFPGGTEVIDRYIGVEVAFPAELDEYFQVRHVKRGAEPVDKLRSEIRNFLDKTVKTARNRVRELWAETDIADQKREPEHAPAVAAFQKMEETAPRGIAGTNVAPEDADRIREETARELGAKEPEEIEQVKEQIRQQSVTVVDLNWPGRELFDIEHLDGKFIFKFNLRHPFFRDVYQPVREVAMGRDTDMSPSELQELAKKVVGAVDLLVLAYAKAENQHPNPEDQYGALRAYWGQFTAEGVRQLLQSR